MVSSLLISGLQKDIHFTRADREVGTLSLYVAFEVGRTLGIRIAESGGRDFHRCDFPTFFSLDQHSGHRLSRRSTGHNRAPIAVELDRWRLDHIGVLPQPGIAGVDRDRGTAV